MKVIAFNGSSRKDGNMAVLIREVFKELERNGIETELVQLAGKKVRGCMACYRCFSRKDGRWAVKGVRRRAVPATNGSPSRLGSWDRNRWISAAFVPRIRRLS